MKVLFLINNLNKDADANVNIALTLASKIGEQCSVCCLAGGDSEDSIDLNKANVFDHVEYVSTKRSEKESDFISRYNWNSGNLSPLQKYIILLSHPKVLCKKLLKGGSDDDIVERVTLAIDEYDNKEHFDAVIAYTSPYFLAEALAKARICGKKMMVQLDPFTNNKSTLAINKFRRKIKEKKTIDKLDCIFTTSIIHKELTDSRMVKKPDSIIEIGFPGIKEYKNSEDVSWNRYSAQFINFVFIGSLPSKIRNPEYMLRVFELLPENYRINIIGNGSEEIIQRHENNLGQRLARFGRVASEEAKAAMMDADILVNLNNTATNQLPSKIFEYFSTGKPVINICKKDECQSIPLIETYGNGITVYEKDPPDYSAKIIKQFAEEHSKTIVDIEETKKRFFKNTDVYVANQILEVLWRKQ